MRRIGSSTPSSALPLRSIAQELRPAHIQPALILLSAGRAGFSGSTSLGIERGAELVKEPHDDAQLVLVVVRCYGPHRPKAAAEVPIELRARYLG